MTNKIIKWRKMTAEEQLEYNKQSMWSYLWGILSLISAIAFGFYFILWGIFAFAWLVQIKKLFRLTNEWDYLYSKAQKGGNN